MILSERVLAAEESKTLAIAATAKAMAAQGIDVVSLSTGEPDFPTPECAKAAAIEAINANFTKYVQSDGIPELREAVANKFRTENGLHGATQKNTLISCGAKHSIFNALTALCNAGDEVVFASPYWVSYPAMCALVGAQAVVVETTLESGWKMTPEQLEAALTPKTKAVILNSPSNPTGAMYTPQEVEALCAVMERYSCFVISDEIYEKIALDEVPHVSFGANARMGDRVITVNGVSKAFAMTGWRIGFMTGPDAVMKEAAKVQSQSTSHPNTVAQKAALAAVLHAAPDVEGMRRVFVERRERIGTLMREIEGARFKNPEGAFYLFVDVRSLLTTSVPTSAELCTFALERHHVALVPGEAFGTPGCVRFSFAASNRMIDQGVERFAAALKSIRA